ncbi:PhzF family phenazine biosynthesis protein [Clostridium botulinum]|nr:PhzF family phenazine biosynthesis protein [Clostridium botulinum]MCS4470129.1 PhzF family phenazine biosynthesis protein [Clostridium botulinum]MCS4478902.1 PhzF family phenazine biosynthesis protein [Clostridium botulinum]MCS4521734.1 PhzF family phenazine biosynthesis protein [Clostridium botulinum]MCS4526031.1 PhzF family phenazine biosynthesis protein [Clostridium botulinum]
MNIYQVNTFTNKVFLGNSIGVCLLNEPVEKDYMENVALELNLSETIFYVRTLMDIKQISFHLKVNCAYV